jgi:hypothetical protein
MLSQATISQPAEALTRESSQARRLYSQINLLDQALTFEESTMNVSTSSNTC